jgi:hypothetical protein
MFYGGYPPSGPNAIIKKLNAWFFRNVAVDGIGCSPEYEKQFGQESNGNIPFYQYRYQFSPKVSERQ